MMSMLWPDGSCVGGAEGRALRLHDAVAADV